MNKKKLLILFISLIVSIESIFSNTMTIEEMESTPETVLFRTGIDLFKKKKYKDSLRYWRFLVVNNPNNAVYYFNYANTHFELKNYKAATHGYKKVKLLKSPLAPAANLFLSKTYIRLHKEELAIKELRKLLGSSTPLGIRSEAKKILGGIDEKEKAKQAQERRKKLSAPLDFPLGLTFFKRQNYQMASIHLEKAAKTYETAELFLVKGICYFKLGNIRMAKRDLARAIKITDDPDIRRNANALLILMKKQKAEIKSGKKNLILSFDLSVNLNNSPFAVSTVDRDTKNSQAILYSEIGWKLISNKKYKLNITYENSFEESFKTSDDRFVEHIGQLKFNTYLLGSSLDIVPKFIRQESGKEPYTEKTGAKLKVSKNFKSNNRVSLEYQNLKNKSLIEDSNYLNGVGEYFRLGLGRRGERFDLSLSLTHSKDNFNDEESNVLSNSGKGITGTLIIYPIEQVSLNTSINYLHKKFKDDPESGFTRVDKSISLTFGISYNMKNKIGVYLNTNLSFVDSNLDEGVDPQNISVSDEIFDFQETLAVGLTWSY